MQALKKNWLSLTIKLAFLAAFFGHPYSSNAAISCDLFLGPNINFDLENDLSQTESRYTFFRGIRDGANALLNNGHIIKVPQSSLRVRRQCSGTCSFASINANYESHLKQRGLIDAKGTLLELGLLIVAMHFEYKIHNTPSESTALYSILNTGFTYADMLKFLSYKKMIYLDANEVTALGGYTAVTRLERAFVAHLKNEFKKYSWELNNLIRQDLDSLFENIQNRWINFVKAKTGFILKAQSLVMDEDIRYSEIAFDWAQESFERPYSGSLALTRDYAIAHENSDEESLQKALQRLRQSTSTQLQDSGIKLNEKANYIDDVLKPITRRILAGDLVSVSLKWTADTGFHTQRHAIVLTNIVVHPVTKAFEGFIYQNSHSRFYGYMGKGFISKKDFKESITNLSVIFFDAP